MGGSVSRVKVLETATGQTSVNPVSVSEPDVTLPQELEIYLVSEGEHINDNFSFLYVTHATDITQFVDMGVGRVLKVHIGDLQDVWMTQDNNDELWSG